MIVRNEGHDISRGYKTAKERERESERERAVRVCGIEVFPGVNPLVVGGRRIGNLLFRITSSSRLQSAEQTVHTLSRYQGEDRMPR
jgi:hypothetical protein